MKPIFLTKQEEKMIKEQLKEFGIEELPFTLLKFGKDRIRAYSGNFDRDELNRISDNIFVELIGVYFAKIDGDEIRLSIDALHLLKEQISKRVIEIDGEQKERYLEGKDIDALEEQKKELGEGRGYFVLKHKEDILGMVKIVEGKIIKNYLPKERRRRV